MGNVPAVGEGGEGRKGISFAGKTGALARSRERETMEGNGLLTLDVSKTVDSSDTISDGWRGRRKRGSRRLDADLRCGGEREREGGTN